MWGCLMMGRKTVCLYSVGREVDGLPQGRPLSTKAKCFLDRQMKNCVSPRSVDNQELVKFRGNAKSWMQMLEGWWWVVFLCGVFTLQASRRETVARALALKDIIVSHIPTFPKFRPIRRSVTCKAVFHESWQTLELC